MCFLLTYDVLHPIKRRVNDKENSSMKIAVTNQDFRAITAHAGVTRRFIVCEFAVDGRLIFEVDHLDFDKTMSMRAFREKKSAHPLDQMDVPITGGAGSVFMTRPHARGVRLGVTGETDPIQAIIDLQNNETKPPNSHSCNHYHHHDVTFLTAMNGDGSVCY